MYERGREKREDERDVGGKVRVVRRMGKKEGVGEKP